MLHTIIIKIKLKCVYQDRVLFRIIDKGVRNSETQKFCPIFFWPGMKVSEFRKPKIWPQFSIACV